jgi:hypothetical protein
LSFQRLIGFDLEMSHQYQEGRKIVLKKWNWPLVVLALLWALLCPGRIEAQTPSRLRGTVDSVDAQGLVLKMDSGEKVTVRFAASLRVQKVSPGERDLSHAQEISITDIVAADRILVRGTQSGDTVTALSLIVMTARDIALRNDQDQQAWHERGTLGMVEQVNVQAGEVRILARGPTGPAPLTVVVDSKTQLRRYPPDSVRYADTVPSRIEEIHTGDQMRALGVKDATGTRVAAEKIVFGSFHTLAGTVAVTAGDNSQLQLKDLMTGKTILVHIKPTTQLKKLPAMGPGMMGGPPGGSAPSSTAGGPEPAGGSPSRPNRLPDLSRFIDRLPETSLAEVKTGDTVVVSCVPGSKPDEYTAVVLLAGVERLLAGLAAQSGGGQRGTSQTGSWPPSMTGEMEGMLGMPGIP